MARSLQRYDVTPILGSHLRGLGNEAAGRRWSAWAVQVGVPALCGVSVGLAGVQFTNLAPLLSAASLFIGVMLSLFVFLVNLRIKASETAKLSYQKTLHRLIASTAVASLYLALVSIVSTAVLAALASVELPFWNGLQLRRVGSALAVALLAHLAVNLLTVLRRGYAIFVDVFGADLGPELRALPQAGNSSRADRVG